jgi:heme-NO-binding protein
MLGMVFTEFFDMVEDRFPPEVSDQLISLAEEKFKSGGIYTSVGFYDHNEMLLLVKQLSEATGIPTADLVEVYGEHLFGRFLCRYPTFFEEIKNSFEFLEGIEAHIHKEVRMLYPEANLPTFECRREGKDMLIMEYASARPFAHLAHGLIKGCAAHYNESIEINMQLNPPQNGTRATFNLKRNEAAN